MLAVGTLKVTHNCLVEATCFLVNFSFRPKGLESTSKLDALQTKLENNEGLQDILADGEGNITDLNHTNDKSECQQSPDKFGKRSLIDFDGHFLRVVTSFLYPIIVTKYLPLRV